MKIGIDLDGVVFDTENLWSTLAEIYDCSILKGNNIISKEEPTVQKKYNWSEAELNNYLNMYVNIEDFNIMAGTREVINLLKKDGYELIVITARGAFSKKGKDIALNILNKNNIEFDKYYWAQSNKLEICKKEKIDIMIDDNYHICKEISKNRIKTLYFKSLGRKSLKTTKYLCEVNSWGEIYRFIKETEEASNK